MMSFISILIVWKIILYFSLYISISIKLGLTIIDDESNETISDPNYEEGEYEG